MKLLRKLLFPFSLLYWIITSIRNFCFDNGILKSYQFGIPIIAVGNLTVGGTGKSPQIEYLIRLLSSKYKIATLSRGYKRKSEGFVLADQNATAETIGDEPFQFFKKFPEIQVAVDANRKNGIEQFLNSQSKPEIILLDDAFQHRKVKADFYILLTTYNDLFDDDFILPVGNLRESSNGAKRASIIVVTKCPKELSEIEMNRVKKKLSRFLLRRNDKVVPIFFSYINYDAFVFSDSNKIAVAEIKQKSKILLAGIAKPKPFFDYLNSGNDVVLEFPDHHDFSEKEIEEIKAKAQNNLIVTTEKDYMRLQGKLPENQLFYLPIKSNFIVYGNDFDKTILDFIKSKN
jgi:tetraacyldisaccharide 4'-kinase